MTSPSFKKSAFSYTGIFAEYRSSTAINVPKLSLKSYTLPVTISSFLYGESVLKSSYIPFVLAHRRLLLSIYKVTRTSSPSCTFLTICLYGKNKSFSSPQSRNAPIFPTSFTLSTARPPNVSFGVFVVAMILSLESLYMNTFILSPGFTPSGTCLYGKSTLSSSVCDFERYIPKSTFFIYSSS